mgnify:CR=1 FL=1
MHAIRRRFRFAPSRRTCVALAIAAISLVAAADAFGCPNCKDAVNTADPDGLNIARGYFYSILIMLAMPFTLVGSFGLYVWREVQRQKRTVIDAAAMPPDASDGPAVAQSPNAALP